MGCVIVNKLKFFSTLFTTVFIMFSVFFALTTELNVFLGGALVGMSVLISGHLAERLFKRFEHEMVSPPTVIFSYVLLLVVATYFIGLYS